MSKSIKPLSVGKWLKNQDTLKGDLHLMKRKTTVSMGPLTPLRSITLKSKVLNTTHRFQIQNRVVELEVNKFRGKPVMKEAQVQTGDSLSTKCSEDWA